MHFPTLSSVGFFTLVLRVLADEKPPSHYGVLLFPQFQALDAFGPIDALNTLHMFYPNYTMHFTVISATSAPINTRIESRRTVNGTHSNVGQSIVPDVTIAEVLKNDGKALIEKTATEKELFPIEVLLVPGGKGAHLDENRTVEIEFIKQMYPKLKYIMSVCTGSALLAQAGILDGKSATTNKRAFPWVRKTAEKAKWVHQARWVEDGNVWTSSGVSAGMDAMYAWISKVYGEKFANETAISSEYVRSTNASYDPFSELWPVDGDGDTTEPLRMELIPREE